MLHTQQKRKSMQWRFGNESRSATHVTDSGNHNIEIGWFQQLIYILTQDFSSKWEIMRTKSLSDARFKLVPPTIK